MKTNSGDGKVRPVARETAACASSGGCAPLPRPGGVRLTERGISFCRFERDPLLLDVGCGTGATVVFLRERYGYKAIAMDSSPYSPGAGMKKIPAFPFLRGDARQLPLRNGALDGITCECVLSLLGTPGTALDEFARVLRPGGYLIMSDLYQRGSGSVSPGNHGECAPCLGGMRSRPAVEGMLAAAGFALLVWEDHTSCLKELAAQLILNGISPADHGGSPGTAGACGMMHSRNAVAGTGYYLLVAGKIT